ncbi:hypothetical protein ES708_22045 [subsurface metagenome]
MAEEKEKFKFYQVEGKAYRQHFTSEIQSRREYGKLKRAGLEDEEAFFVKLSGRNGLKEEWILLDEIQIEEGYFE